MMLELEQLTDCQFVFPQEEDKEKSIIKAHKLFLAFASPVFNKMFYTFSYNENEYNTVEILDITSENFALFLKYVYLHEIEFTQCNEAIELYRIAHKYEVPGLEKICEDYIIANTGPDQACSVRSFAELHDNAKIKDKAEDVIVRETEQVLVSQDFLEAQIDTVEFIMKCENLNVQGEGLLFEALNKYAIKNGYSSKDVDGMLKEIRFLTIGVEEFNEKVMWSGLVTDTEKLAILNTKLSENRAVYRYPEGFSRNLNVRMRRDDNVRERRRNN